MAGYVSRLDRDNRAGRFLRTGAGRKRASAIRPRAEFVPPRRAGCNPLRRPAAAPGGFWLTLPKWKPGDAGGPQFVGVRPTNVVPAAAKKVFGDDAEAAHLIGRIVNAARRAERHHRTAIHE